MRTVRRLLVVIASLVAVLVVWSGVAAVVYSPTYVARVLTMRKSSQADYLERFPTRTLSASPVPHSYPGAPDPAVEEQVLTAFDTDDLGAFLESTATQAFLVIDDGRLVLEAHANGAERDTMTTSFSVAKSFDSILVGIAVDEGLLEADDPITDLLPELADRDPDLSAITVAHLLSMSSGLEFQEMRWGLFNSDDALTTYHPDQRSISLEAATRLVEEPGLHFQYNKYHPQLIGMILERVTGMSVTDWTQSRLWDPLGMEFDGEWTLDSEEHGFEKMEAGLNARAIDFAKLGSLVLAGGEWNGTRIVSEAWIDASTGPDVDRDVAAHYIDDFGQWIYSDGAGWYGWFWYGRARAGSDPDVFAEGDHGQFIYVCRASERVVVRIGTEFGMSSAEWVDAFYRLCSTDSA